MTKTATWDGIERRQRTTARFEGKDRRSKVRAFLKDFTESEHPLGFLICSALGHGAEEEIPESFRSKRAREAGHVWTRCSRCKAPTLRTSY